MATTVAAFLLVASWLVVADALRFPHGGLHAVTSIRHGCVGPIIRNSPTSALFARKSPKKKEDGIGADQLESSGKEVLHFDLQSRVDTTELNVELKSAFMSYAMSTILSRALPDIRDGLKPVHRRVLYAMHSLGLGPDATYRKCARIVGEVLGKFHPHGDQSVYDALVRMAQDFVMMHTLIKGHGNFGSIDDDPAAAMRYTEAKLSHLALDALLEDIKEGTVDFQPNFDGSESEPCVLPARLPLLLINGASGIAVGMATNIPPHNLGEIADAMIALIDNPTLSDKELLDIVPAPDFPTGGELLGTDGAKDLALTGHGSVLLRAKTRVETIGKRTAIVVTEVPYLTNKAALLEKMAELVNDKRLEGISDLRDESDREGIRIVVELKRDANPDVVLNNLFKKTGLQTSFPGNILALTEAGTVPKRLSLRDAIREFIAFRFVTVRRRAAHQLQKLRSRNHIVLGLIKALQNIDVIVETMKSSADGAAAKKALLDLDFSDTQAEAVLSLTLRRLTALEDSKLQQEHQTLLSEIAVQETLVTNDDSVYDTIKRETQQLRDRHAVPRRSVIVSQAEAKKMDISEKDLVPNDQCVIILTHSGYIKRLAFDEFEAQSRGGKGKQGTKLKNVDDSVAHFFACRAHDSVLFFTDRGVAYNVPAYSIPIASRIAKGVPLPQIVGVKVGLETVTSVIPVDSFEATPGGEAQHLVLLTQQGWLKKTSLSAFSTRRSSGLMAISLGDQDSLRWARLCRDQDEIIVGTKKGYAGRFRTANLRESQRSSRGVISLRLRKDDSVADMDILNPETASTLLAVTERGYGKRLEIEDFTLGKRGKKGVIAIKFKEKTRTSSGSDTLLALRACGEKDDLVLSTVKGAVMRQRVGEIAVKGRAATGVVLQNIELDDAVVMVDVVSPPTGATSVASTVPPATVHSDPIVNSV